MVDDAPADVIIGELTKNTRESLVVALTRFGGHDLVSARVFAPGKGDEMVPTRAGLSIRLALLDELLALLTKARDEAKARGLL